MTTPNILSTQETNRLLHLEAVIETHKQAFLEVGAALLEIQEKRLYREQYNTFEEYISEKHGIGRSTAYQYIKAAEVRQDLVQNGVTELPQNEAQYRVLTSVIPERRAKVWEQTTQFAEQTGEKVTAKVLSAIADKTKPKVEVQEVEVEEVRQTIYIDTPVQEMQAPQQVRQAGFGLGGLHKKTANPQVLGEPNTLEEKIAVLSQRPTQLEHEILAGELSRLKEEVFDLKEELSKRPTLQKFNNIKAQLLELKSKVPAKAIDSYKNKEVTSDLLRKIVLEKYVDGHVFINYHALTTDLMQHCKDFETKSIPHKLLNGLAKSLAASDLFLTNGDKLTLRREKPAPSEDFSNYFMFKPPSNEMLQSIIQQYFPLQVDASEDEYMYDTITYKKRNSNTFITFSSKRAVGHFYFSVYVSNQQPNDLSGDYLNAGISMKAKNEEELQATLKAIC